MDQFVVCGVVGPWADRKTIKVHNHEEMLRWWSQHRIDTKPEFRDGEVDLNKQDLIARCVDGDTVEYTMEWVDRNTTEGVHRGVRGVALKVVGPHDKDACHRRSGA